MTTLQVKKIVRKNIVLTINGIGFCTQACQHGRFWIHNEKIAKLIAVELDQIFWHDAMPEGGFIFGNGNDNLVSEVTENNDLIVYEETEDYEVINHTPVHTSQEVPEEQLLNCDNEEVRYFGVPVKPLFDFISLAACYSTGKVSKNNFKESILFFNLPKELEQHIIDVYKF